MRGGILTAWDPATQKERWYAPGGGNRRRRGDDRFESGGSNDTTRDDLTGIHRGQR